MDPAISRGTTRKTTCGYRWGYLSVAPTVGDMTSSRLAYDDLSTPAEMGTDAIATLTALGWVPSTYTPREATKRGEIEIPEAASRLARAIYGDDA